MQDPATTSRIIANKYYNQLYKKNLKNKYN
jgi:hypothetical protein